MSLFSNRIFVCVCCFLIAYAIAVGVRLQEAPAWSDPALSVQGEKLQATHDAYLWLAGAKGTSWKPDKALARVTSWVHGITGLQLGNVGFWLPAFVAPLAVLPFILLGWLWRLEEGSLTAGVMAACAIGFLLRTRLGFYDTDILTLFFPLFFYALLIAVFSRYLRSGWLKKAYPAPELSEKDRFEVLLRSIGVGLAGMVYMWFYPIGQVLILAGMGVLLLCILLLARDWTTAGFLILGYLAVLGLSLGGYLSWVVIGLVVLVLWRGPHYLESVKRLGACLALVAVIVFIDCNLSSLIGTAAGKLLGYAKLFSTEVDKGDGLKLPSVYHSVREAQTIDWSVLIPRLAGHWAVFGASVLGLIIVFYYYPLALVFIPLLGLSIFSFKLGNRFAMYGGAVLGLGLGFGLSLFMVRLQFSRWIRFCLQLALCGLVVIPVYHTVQGFRPAPILPQSYARTLIELKDKAAQEARLWQWWDYGYAAQYYAERITFGDGGWNQGHILYPLAKVHVTPSPLQAKQLMQAMTVNQQEDSAANSTKNEDVDQLWGPYRANPMTELQQLGPQDAQAFIKSLTRENGSLAAQEIPPQYLVLSWENLRLAYWISNYGTWDLKTGHSSPGRIQRVRGKLKFDIQKGQVRIPQGNIVLDGLDVIGQQGGKHFSWGNGTGLFAILNQFSNEVYVMDGTIYKSVMVQMLISDPQKYEQDFDLVVDNWPWARAYRVQQE